ncbi:MAG: non-homologous end-joining DNA ligase [Chloroflexota bacterium]
MFIAVHARTPQISHADKVLFPDIGLTKGELAAYYDEVADVMLPHLRDRPVTMERFPAGIAEPGFIQKDVTKGFPSWLQRVEAPKRGGVVHYPLINDRPALLWMANQNCVTPHVWCSRAPRLLYPDICVVDLDPAQDHPAVLRRAALDVRALLDELSVPSWVKTSGSKGFHIVVPSDGESTYDDVAVFANRLAATLVQRDPEHLTLEFMKADRGGRIFVDVGRNGYSATCAAPYAVRARPGAPVSAPCTWSEVESGDAAPRSVNVRNMAERLSRLGDLWADLLRIRCDLRAAHKRLVQEYPGASGGP